MWTANTHRGKFIYDHHRSVIRRTSVSISLVYNKSLQIDVCLSTPLKVIATCMYMDIHVEIDLNFILFQLEHTIATNVVLTSTLGFKQWHSVRLTVPNWLENKICLAIVLLGWCQELMSAFTVLISPWWCWFAELLSSQNIIFIMFKWKHCRQGQQRSKFP